MKYGATGDEQLRHLEFIVEKTAHAVVVTNPNREIEWVSSAYSHLTGWTLEEIKGRNPRSFLHGAKTNAKAASRIGSQLRSGLPVRDVEMLNYKKSGEPYWVSLSIEPVVDPSGEVTKYIALERDITHRKLAEVEATRKHSIWGDAYRLARLATIHHDLATDVVRCSPEILRCLGLSASDTDYPLSELKRHVHPSDIDAVRLQYEHAVNSGEPFDMEFRAVAANGTVKWFHGWGELAGWDDGHSVTFRLVLQDIGNRRARDAEIDASEPSDRAAKLQMEVLSRVSHEMRTPLHAVIGFATMIERAEAARMSERSRGNLGQIQTSATRLLHLINDILDLTRLQSAQSSMDIQSLDLLAIARDVQSLVEPLAADRGVTVLITEHEVPVYAFGDQQRLTQVVINLVKNAIDYNRQQGQVHIQAKQIDSMLVALEITDTGIGILDSDLTHLFDPFYQVPAAKARKPNESSGLGLAIARSLVREMGGDISVESEIGVGSTFVVTLPRAELPGGSVREDQPDRVKRTVLYIEDNDVNCRIVAAYLESRSELNLLCASSGADGVALARQLKPDVILVDLNLFDMTGHEVVQRILADPDLAGIPCIAFSADGDAQTIEQSKRSGFREYLSKPVGPDQLLSALDRYLSSQEPPATH